jgi:hypothetical protein
MLFIWRMTASKGFVRISGSSCGEREAKKALGKDRGVGNEGMRAERSVRRTKDSKGKEQIAGTKRVEKGGEERRGKDGTSYRVE